MMVSSTGCPTPDSLRQLVTGRLDESIAAELHAHLKTCSECRALLGIWESTEKGPAVPGEIGWTETAMDQTASIGLTPTRTHERTPVSTRPEVLEDETAEHLDLSFLLPATEPGAIGRLDHYEVREMIGRGGMGIVFRAFDPHLRRIVAIKVMAHRLASSERGRRRFLREARSAAAINHPNVVTIHAVGTQAEIPYLVMECVAGPSLRERIREGPRLEPYDICRIAYQVAEGLAAAHEHGLIHRDVKPANIMLENGIERVKITDFGLALAAMTVSELTSDDQLVGTPAYMSPEQVQGLPLDARSDLFSLGAVIYAMVAGHSPFRGSHTLDVIYKVSTLRPVRLEKLDDRIPPELSQVVERLLEKEPDKRFLSANEVAAQLKAMVADRNAANQRSAEFVRETPGQDNEDAAPKPERNPRPASTWKRPLVFGLVAVAALALAWFRWPHAFRTPTAKSFVSGIPEQSLNVGHSPSAQYPTLERALASVTGPGATIRILDEGEFQGPLLISDPNRLRKLTIEAPKGATITAPAHSAAVVTIADTPEVTLRGLTIRSLGSQFGLEIHRSAEGVSLQNVHFVKPIYEPGSAFHSHVWMAYNAQGSEDSPIRFDGCDFSPWPTGLVLQGNAGGTVGSAVIEGCRFASRLRQIELIGPIRDVTIRDNLFMDGDDGVFLDNLAHGTSNIHIIRNRFYRVGMWINPTMSTPEASDIEIAENVIFDAEAIDVAGGRLADLQRRGWRIHDNLWETPTPRETPLASPREQIAVQSRVPTHPDFLRPTMTRNGTETLH